MAITITYAPVELTGDQPLHAFNDNTNIFKLSTNNTDASLISCEILAQPSGTVIAQQFAHVLDNNAVFNLRGCFTSIVPSFNNFITEPAALPTSGNVITYVNTNHTTGIKLKFSEFNSLNELVNPLTTDYYRLLKVGVNEYLVRWNTDNENIAFFAYAYPDAVTTQVKRYAFKGQLIPIVTIGQTGGAATFQLRLNGSAIGAKFDYSNVMMASHLLRDPGTGGYNVVTLGYEPSVVFDQSTSMVYYAKTKPCRGGTIYFLNPWGGWEWFNYIDYEETSNVKKSEYEVYDNAFFGSTSYHNYIGKSLLTKKLFSDYRDGTNNYYLRYLLSSPIVLDEQGQQVRVVSSSMLTNTKEIYNPDVTIEYISKDIINY